MKSNEVKSYEVGPSLEFSGNSSSYLHHFVKFYC